MIQKNIDVGLMTTFKISCLAKSFAAPTNSDELIEVLKFAKQKKMPFVLLGGGSNTLFAGEQYAGLVISTEKLNQIKLVAENIVEVSAGVSIDSLGAFLIEHELSGLEFAGGLPGSVGGALCMNARAYGAEFADLVLNVSFLDADLRLVTMDSSLLKYGYKQSIFMDHPEYIIVSSKLRFNTTKRELVVSEWEKNRLDRIKKDQFKYPSAGCVFKNCYELGIPTGKLIDDLGLKGKRIGDAMVFDKHANFIVNAGNANAKDVIALIELIESEVKNKKNVKLEREVRIIL